MGCVRAIKGLREDSVSGCFNSGCPDGGGISRLLGWRELYFFPEALWLETVVVCYPGREAWPGRDAHFLVSGGYNL